VKSAGSVWLLDEKAANTQDRPIEQEADDELDREAFVESLGRALVHTTRDAEGKVVSRRSTGFVVGLTGSWGAGKSSVLNLLALHLGSLTGVVVAKFNPWLFRGRDELLTAFFNELRQAMGRSKAEHRRELVAALDRYRGAIRFSATVGAAGVDLLGAGGAASATLSQGKRFWPWPKEKHAAVSIEEERLALEAKLKKFESAVVVLVDELDRVENEDVRSVAQLIKAVGDIRGISYLVAYDPERVADALGRGAAEERRTSGHAYLEKIIQHPIPMRPLFAEDVDRLLRSALSRYAINLPDPEAKQDAEILKLLKEELSTPREVKRLIGSFAVIEESVRGEVNPIHVLAYCWLLTKTPAIRGRIAALLDRFVDDPTETEMVRRTTRKMDQQQREALADETIIGAEATRYEPLLKKLFLRFSDERSTDGTRLSLRRNLVRVLYLGNPPGAPSRADIEQVWGLASADDIEALLREMLTDGSLPGFLDRLDDLLPKLPQSGDQAFWIGLSRALTRSTDWLHGPEPERRLADDAATSLYRLGIRNRADAPRVHKVIDSLIQAGDLIFVPWILRKLMFLHGLVIGEDARPGEELLDESMTSSLLDREVRRYILAFLDGTLLKRLPTVEAWFVLKNGGFWNSELFASLSDQLKRPEALMTLAGLLTPPGYVITRDTLDEMFDAETVAARLQELPPVSDPWLRESIKRLKLTLAGQDPTFAKGEDADEMDS
jgi:predicted KAP-like P-loop ATPase